jgi:hypothetical protein
MPSYSCASPKLSRISRLSSLSPKLSNRYRYTSEVEFGPERECRASQRRPFFARAFMLEPDFWLAVNSRHRLASLPHNLQRNRLLKRHWSKWENRHH